MSGEDEAQVRRTKTLEAMERMLADPAAFPMPRSFHAEFRKAITWLRDYRDDPEGRPDLDEALRTKFPAYLRDAPQMRRLRKSGVFTFDVPPDAVTVRWDLLDAKDRPAAYSYLNALVDGMRDRSVGGRPR